MITALLGAATTFVIHFSGLTGFIEPGSYPGSVTAVHPYAADHVQMIVVPSTGVTVKGLTPLTVTKLACGLPAGYKVYPLPTRSKIILPGTGGVTAATWNYVARMKHLGDKNDGTFDPALTMPSADLPVVFNIPSGTLAGEKVEPWERCEYIYSSNTVKMDQFVTWTRNQSTPLVLCPEIGGAACNSATTSATFAADGGMVHIYVLNSKQKWVTDGVPCPSPSPSPSSARKAAAPLSSPSPYSNTHIAIYKMLLKDKSQTMKNVKCFGPISPEDPFCPPVRYE